jgi:predicted TIM-barrel fold metal-dependent hydrolase
VPLDLAAVPVLDHHCHALLRPGALASAAFQQFFTESLDPTVRTRDVPATVFFRRALRELAGYLGCATSLGAVLGARAAAGDGLAGRMLRDANIAVLVVDLGYQVGEMATLAELRARLPCRIHSILRLETLAQELILRHARFDAVVDAFVAAVERARAAGHVALKSIIAYRTGLAVGNPSRAEAARAFGSLRVTARREGRLRLAAKPVTDYLLRVALDVAARQALPVQFHTGFGDSDVDLLQANPLLLRPLLEDRRFAAVPFVLLHAAYPYVRELSYLASLYPNVHLDLGLAIPHVASDLPSVVRQALSLAPTSRVLFSSDASGLPELYWLAARWGRRALGTVLEELVEDGALGRDEALEVAGDILGRNAAHLYGVSFAPA